MYKQTREKFGIYNRKFLRVKSIEGITGLKDLSFAFEDDENETEIDNILRYLENKYDFSEGVDDPLSFMIRIGFSEDTLMFINAYDPEFYDHLTIREAIEIILFKCLSDKRYPSKNGFPKEFNFNSSQSNRKISLPDGNLWFPLVQNSNRFNYDKILANVLSSLQTENCEIFFHGTSWESAISIMETKILTSRNKTTDFGMNNFYVTDNFKTACKWSNHFIQGAVVVFIIPSEQLETENSLRFSSDDIYWKEFVFKVRNRPSRGNYNSSEEFRIARNEYDAFLNDVEDKDFILGPIFANPSVENVEDVKCIKYDNNDFIPFQYSFKNNFVQVLNNCIKITIFFQEAEV